MLSVNNTKRVKTEEPKKTYVLGMHDADILICTLSCRRIVPIQDYSPTSTSTLCTKLHQHQLNHITEKRNRRHRTQCSIFQKKKIENKKFAKMQGSAERHKDSAVRDN